MKTYKIIGVMTGNSMDAIDLVLTEFKGQKMYDVCALSVPFEKELTHQMDRLRLDVAGKTKDEILALPHFQSVHDAYVQSVASAVNQMCTLYRINKDEIDAIGFHGKTLDHNPPSKAKKEGSKPYTLQIGSGKMLADLTNIKVVYDFRSAFVLHGFDGAPLIAPHNAHIALIEGDGIYYNGGNTSNFAIISKAKAIISADSGPFNAYIDSFIRSQRADLFDKDGKYGLKGVLNMALVQELFDINRAYFETKLPKSGDPRYYHQEEVFEAVKKSGISFEDAVRTLEFFAAYIAVQGLTLIDQKINLPSDIILFGGGWKNPVVLQSFKDILKGQGAVLPEHQNCFKTLLNRFEKMPKIRYSAFGEMMEARLMADMAYYCLQEKPWKLPEVKTIVAGRIAEPESGVYDDVINLAAKD